MLSHTIYRRHRAQRDAITRTRTNRTNQPNTRKSTSLLLQGNRGGETETRAEPNQPESQQKANWQIAPNTTPNHPPPSPTINIPTQSTVQCHQCSQNGRSPKIFFLFFTVHFHYKQKKSPFNHRYKLFFLISKFTICYNNNI